MKKLTLLFFLLAFILQSTASEITGTLKNHLSSAIVIYTTSDGVNSTQATVPVKNGVFRYQINLKSKGQYVTLNFDEQSWDVYLAPGQSLDVQADLLDYETMISSLRFKGTAAVYNNHIMFLRRTEEMKGYQINMEAYRLKKEPFVAMLKQRTRKIDSLNLVFFGKLSPAEIASQEIRNYRLIDSISNVYLNLSVLRSYAGFRIKSFSDRKVFVDRYIGENISLSNSPVYLASDKYRNFWSSYLEARYDQESWSRDTTKVYEQNRVAFFERLPTLMKEQMNIELSRATADYFLSNMHQDYRNLKTDNTDTLDRVVDQLMSYIKNPARALELQKRIQVAKQEKFAVGKPAVDFIMLDSANATYKLSSFKGKAVYIDVWASWCGPCIQEMPSLKKLSDKYKSNPNIQFVSLSVDDTKTVWLKKGLAVQKPDGFQVWVEGGFASPFAKSYSISSIPRFILIDKKGLVVTLNASRPSELLQDSKIIDDIL
ncbi:MAG: TlpA disulfide reductase family protein [Bacteroidota bacterium]